MPHKVKYSIGEVSQICNVSKKALRYYDKIGLISTQRKDYNNYRYYTSSSLLAVPIIKYYKQMGFKLEEMREFIEGNIPNVYQAMQESFRAKIVELETTQQEIHQQYNSVKDWYNLVAEAEKVIENCIEEVAIKYVEPGELLFFEQNFTNDIQATIINIDFSNYVESQGTKITGPVILNFSSHKDRINGLEQKIRVLQKPLLPSSPAVLTKVGGHIMASCYHIGPHETIGETYKRILRWAERHSYILEDESYERYVIDYWTTRNSSKFVTEVRIQVARKGMYSQE